jgi:hypothetical protein
MILYAFAKFCSPEISPCPVISEEVTSDTGRKKKKKPTESAASAGPQKYCALEAKPRA